MTPSTYFQAHLASIHDDEEFDFLMMNQPEKAEGERRAYYWIDGKMKEDVFQEFSYGNWMWTDGSNMCNLKKLVSVDACTSRKCRCLKLQLYQGCRQILE